MKRTSLRRQLIISFCLLLLLAWITSTAISYVKTRHRIRYIFDAQQLILAQRLEDSNLNQLVTNPTTSPLLSQKQNQFRKANDALSFAIFTVQGKLLITDRPDALVFSQLPTIDLNNQPQFTNSDDWRILWYKTADQHFVIAVGQENSYRNTLTRKIITDHQVTPWFIIFPVLIVLLIMLINRALAPVKQVSQQLSLRVPGDSTPINNDKLPSEIQPLINELNTLFERISATMERERRFVSDAAHELRTPLTALKVQTEVAQLSLNKPETLIKALDNLNTGITRSSHLVEQLLTLSKLDAVSELKDQQPVNWPAILQTLLAELDTVITNKNITIEIDTSDISISQEGNPLLLSLMVRNLIDNAVRYTTVGGKINIVINNQGVVVSDNGPGVTENNLGKIGQRFYRPPGQNQTGSGLGLSITQQIAQLHGFSLSFGNRPEGGFLSKISFNQLPS